MKRQWHLLQVALLFYTRLPVNPNVGHGADDIARATRFLPLVGWIIGGMVAAVWYGAALVWPASIAAGLALAAGIWLTGAFHEDGWADTCDALGAGWTPEQILAILKDSRLGTYGVTGLFLLLGTKWAALSQFSPWMGALAILSAHSLSRTAPVWIIRWMEYARKDGETKAKPVAVGISNSGLLQATAFGLIPLLAVCVWSGNWRLLAAVPAVALAGWLVARAYRQKLGGYTGDGLGAAQQLAEVFMLLAWLAVGGLR